MKNRVQLIGNLGMDVNLIEISKGQKLANCSLATTASYQDKKGKWQDKTTWHKITAFGPLAERMANALSKGALVGVEGKLSNRSYENNNGDTVYTTEIIVSNFYSMSKKAAA